ncbi:MAG TPA: lysine--tRNA ligase [Myxococcota bacterium]|nr:lysine--tRNA ligase [Myxococcota bacterium]
MSEQERESRRARLAALRAAGVDPYPAQVEAFVPIPEVRRAHDAKSADELAAAPPTVAVVGRIRAARSFGKLLFLTLDQDGASLQVTVRKSEVPAELFEFAKSLDVADFVRAEGPLWRTQKGELSVDARQLAVLAKSLRPLPEKWHGLQDVEARYRQRYLDLIVNERAREIAITRSRAVSALRAFMDGAGFLEVETPVLQPLYGGASARPFTTHYHVYDQEVFLRISDELYLKRLVIGGLDRVYEIGRDFRNEGVDRKRNPEFTMLECYQAYGDYRDMMRLVQGLVQHVAREVTGGLQLTYKEHKLDLSGEWRATPLCDAIRDATGIDVLAAPDHTALAAAVRAKGFDPGGAPTWAQLVDHLFSEHVEPNLIQPTFLTDYPVELSPLAKRSTRDPRLVERFELFAAGMEIANAFSELNDPEDQRARFEEQRRAAAAGDADAQPLDEDFIAALEHGMPPTGGLGVGIDRVAMLLCDAAHLREVLLFPYMRPERA